MHYKGTKTRAEGRKCGSEEIRGRGNCPGPTWANSSDKTDTVHMLHTDFEVWQT